MKRLFILLLGFFMASIALEAQVTVTSTDTFITRDQMLLANEINESGEPFAEALGYDLDELDPMVLNQPDSVSYTLGIENYEYSRYQLGTVISRSGIGLHMMWAPMIMQMAAMEPDGFDGSMTGAPNGYNEDDELMKNIMHFATLANGMAPMNPWPQFAEFQSGDPHLPQAVADDFRSNFASLRWDRSKMDKTFNLGAMGQTLMKQYLWAQDMLGTFHDGNEDEVVPTGSNSPDLPGSPHFDPNNDIYYGGDNTDGFIGQVLTAEGINKTMFLINSLAYNGSELGMVNPATYNPLNDGILYFPHGISVTESPVAEGLPPQASNLQVSDASSDIFDQLSYLWGTLNFKNMMDPSNNSDEPHWAYHTVFDGDPFPASMSQTGMPGPFDLMMGTSKVIFINLMAMHFDQTNGSFVNTSGLSNGIPIPGTEISTINAGYITMVMVKTNEEFTDTPIEQMALNAVNAQASFIVNSLQDPAGGFYNGYTLNVGPDNSAKTAASQAAAARGLYAAYSLTGNTDYLDAANAAYDFLIANFYDAGLMAFKTELGNDIATYTSFNFAVIAGGLREAALVGENLEAAEIYTRFFKTVANTMQLAEFDPSGETGGDSDGDGVPFIQDQPDQLAPIFATEAQLDFTVGEMNVYLKDSNGDALAGGMLEYKDGGWQTATEIEEGVFFVVTDKDDVKLRMTYVGAQLYETVPTSPDHTFQTVLTTFELRKRDGNLGYNWGEVSFATFGAPFGYTGEDGLGLLKKELLPRQYTFRMKFRGGVGEITQDVGTDPIITWKMARMMVQVNKSDGTRGINGIEVLYKGHAQHNYGTTGQAENGRIRKDLLPGFYKFTLKYFGGEYIEEDFEVVVDTDNELIIDAQEVTVELLDFAGGSPMDGGKVRNQGGSISTNVFGYSGDSGPGIVTHDLLPLTYDFSMTYDGDSDTKTVDCTSGAWITFNYDEFPKSAKINNGDDFQLIAYPNPFQGNTTIGYSLEETQEVTIEVYDQTGRLIETLYEGFQTEGNHKITWNSNNMNKGVYFVRLNSNGKVINKNIVKM